MYILLEGRCLEKQRICSQSFSPLHASLQLTSSNANFHAFTARCALYNVSFRDSAHNLKKKKKSRIITFLKRPHKLSPELDLVI